MKKLGLAVVGVASFILVPAVPAFADKPVHEGNPHASCTGLALSEHAVNDGPGTISGLVVEVRQLAGEFGFDNGGHVISKFSQVHAGTHVPGCEDAFFAILTGGPAVTP